MADIKLFNISGNVREYKSQNVALEKELQTVIENNMATFFGVKFLASEYTTTHGRMDSIGIDENHCPVIFEYKRSISENVINQGLFYLDWLLDHKDSFKMLVMKKVGPEEVHKIDWTMPRIICIASNFTKYDEHAIKQMNRNVSLIRYKKFGDNMLMFEHINENIANNISDTEISTSKTKSTSQKTFNDQLKSADNNIKMLYQDLTNYILSLGDDIHETRLKTCAAFKKIRNIATVVAQKKKLVVHLPLKVTTVTLEKGFSRDVTGIGHWGCGDIELSISNYADFEKAKPLISRSYNEN